MGSTVLLWHKEREGIVSGMFTVSGEQIDNDKFNFKVHFQIVYTWALCSYLTARDRGIQPLLVYFFRCSF